jgi:hypothetical protein
MLQDSTAAIVLRSCYKHRNSSGVSRAGLPNLYENGEFEGAKSPHA